jgi:hypothetical protein
VVQSQWTKNSASVAGSRLLKQRNIREEIERLQAGIAHTGNAIMAKG